MSSFITSPELPIRYRKDRLHLFSDKIAELTLKVDQGRWRWHNNQTVTYYFLLVDCSNHVFILYFFWDIQRRIMNGMPLKSVLMVI